MRLRIQKEANFPQASRTCKQLTTKNLIPIQPPPASWLHMALFPSKIGFRLALNGFLHPVSSAPKKRVRAARVGNPFLFQDTSNIRRIALINKTLILARPTIRVPPSNPLIPRNFRPLPDATSSDRKICAVEQTDIASLLVKLRRSPK
jgi:hypothetical protein